MILKYHHKLLSGGGGQLVGGALLRRVDMNHSLTNKQKRQRLEYLVSKVSLVRGKYTLKENIVRIFVDEKWFYVDTVADKIKCLPYS